ncbi:hypothetical protein CXF35_04125 [Corynebacterium bovis]|uniref:YtxH domain-containing protein n=3 Tax=Corynebacterium bovis TaxID=36808 RepID=A0A3R8PJ82_9CORY|nr:hypothetical protein [Corynebacterium bovis]QQC48437.1 hypothetical protein I6I09_03870 [Corynebacterium bovis]RRO80900.1 hypothetical protein CXF38_05375 [Corynebacterium bovis]RRO81895.1 hypothetical protein CXF36_06335 [Corynebacterium bovis]RRO83374.1 hypothetical protein CXF37_05320 [Corynebacterium bovis]RRO87736.1 hypothetical protein CXF48_01845 [Corynebacterium bovis]
MIQLVVGAAAGYLMGTKAGRRRYEQIRRGYEAAVNSPATRAAVRAGRKAIADRLDPEPRMREVRDLRRDLDGTQIVEPDSTPHEQDRIEGGDRSTDRRGRGRRRDR